MGKTVVVEGSLHSFLIECGRKSKTSGFHYKVLEKENGIRIEHANWICYHEPYSVYVLGYDGQKIRVSIPDKQLYVNGTPADKVAGVGWYDFSADEIIKLVEDAIARWYLAKFYGETIRVHGMEFFG